MPTAPSKLAVVVRGGWNGHSPVEATDMFIPHLEAHGFEVQVAHEVTDNRNGPAASFYAQKA